MILRVALVLLVAWLALMPPFFTGGACTAEFNREASRVDVDRERLRTAAKASEYWSSRQVPHTVLTADQCRKRKPRFLSACASGTLVYAEVPVENTICRLYRDEDIRVQLQYDERGRLARTQVDMDPYKSLPIPGMERQFHWGR